MQVSVCVGNYAKTPYYVEGLEIPVYSMEELCYCIRENAFLLDISFMNDSLIAWIDAECGLRELARELYPLVHRQGTLSAFVMLILEYTGFFPTQCMYEVEQVLKQGAGLSIIEKRKSRIDYLVKKKKYALAIQGYDNLLEKWQDYQEEQLPQNLPGAQIRAAILYNRGAAYAGLMIYERAAENFWEAWQLDKKDEYVISYMAAKRMELPEDEYVAFIAQLPQCFEQSLALEKQLEQLKEAWIQCAEYQQMQERFKLREGSEIHKYYEENDRLTQALKNSYRSSVQE